MILGNKLIYFEHPNCKVEPTEKNTDPEPWFTPAVMFNAPDRYWFFLEKK